MQAGNKTQSFKMWPKLFIKSFASSLGSSLQMNLKFIKKNAS